MAKSEILTATPRDVKPIKPDAVTIEASFHTYKMVSVNLPDEFVLQDLNEPSIWKLVQQANSATCRPLAANDKLELRARDWTVYAAVSAIDKDSVILYDIRKVSKPQRTVELFQDDDYRIGMVGAQYAVFSKKNNNVNPHGGQLFATVDAAKQFLLSNYSRKVA